MKTNNVTIPKNRVNQINLIRQESLKDKSMEFNFTKKTLGNNIEKSYENYADIFKKELNKLEKISNEKENSKKYILNCYNQMNSANRFNYS